jgi:carbon-monoxide dehydrogenase small subunit
MKYGAAQCGFCTPAMVLAGKNLLDHNPSPSKEEIKEAISGVLCRCTGYYKIIDAIHDAAKEISEVKS